MNHARLLTAMIVALPAAAQAQGGMSVPGRGADWVLGPGSVGPIQLGMTRHRVEQLLGVQLEENQIGTGCVEGHHGTDYGGLTFDFDQGVLVKIYAVEPATAHTARGIRPNSRMSDVTRLYGPVRMLPAGRHGWQGRAQLQSEVGPAAGVRYLLYWTGPDRVIGFFGGRNVDNVTIGSASLVRPGSCGSVMTPD
jgi:hypothetical protein